MGGFPTLASCFRCVLGSELSGKLQASGLTAAVGCYRMYLERNNYGYNTIEKNSGRPGRNSSAGKAGSREVYSQRS